MKVILLQDVKNLGKKGELVEANDGYARNFILPKKLGVEATPKNLNDLRQQKLNEEKHQAEILAEAEAVAEALKGKRFLDRYQQKRLQTRLKSSLVLK